MRKPLVPPAWLLLFVLAACNSATGPTIYSAVGTWKSMGFPSADIQMTLVETARTTDGAGSFSTPDSAFAFAVTGAHAGQSISLLLDFQERTDISFQGSFRTMSDTTFMSGTLNGSGFRGDSIDFKRIVKE